MKKMLAGALAATLLLGVMPTTVAADEGLPPRTSPQGACLLPDGRWSFPVDTTIFDPPPIFAKEKCEQTLNGFWYTAAQYDNFRAGAGVYFVPTDGSHGRAAANANVLPADWYGKPPECAWLPSTRSTTGDNLLMDVHIAESAELLFQGAYNIGSNELTGIAGVFLGIALSGAQAIRYEIEWRYELQAECKDIVTARQVASISDRLDNVTGSGTVAADAATAAAEATDNGLKIDSISGRLDQANTRLQSELDTNVGSRASQASADAILAEVDTILSRINAQLDVNVGSRASQASVDEVKVIAEETLGQASRTLAEVENQIDTNISSRASQASVDELRVVAEETLGQASRTLAEVEDQIDTNISSRASQASADAILSRVDTQLDVNVGSRASQASLDDVASALDARIADETADLRGRVEQLRADLGAESQRNIDFFIEQNLASCTVLAVFLVDDGPGLQGETFAFVGGLIAAFGQPAKATTRFAEAEVQRDAGNAKPAYESLCKAYSELVKS